MARLKMELKKSKLTCRYAITSQFVLVVLVALFFRLAIFDAVGNLQGYVYPNNVSTIYGYDLLNRLTNVAALNPLTTAIQNYAYQLKPTGHRASVAELGGRSVAYAQVLEEHVSLNSQPSILNCVYTYGHNLISQDRLDGSQWMSSFYGYDGHHNVRYLTDLNGNVTDTYDYDAFGNVIAASGNTPNVYLFTGAQFDLDLGLYFLRARYHNPDTGRFWTMDTFEGFGADPTSLHKYLYANANPANMADPTGLSTTVADLNVAMALDKAIVQTLRVVGLGIYLAHYASREYVVYSVFGAAHSSMFIERAGTGNGWRYDLWAYDNYRREEVLHAGH